VTSHVPVLLEEAVQQLRIDPDGIYFDGTFGRGGHSQEILKHLRDGGRLLAMDHDPEAVKIGEEIAAVDSRFEIEQGSFGQLRSYLERQGVFGNLMGILLDLGVSSPQLDDPARGFSFRSDGPLDMRMNSDAPRTASSWLNSASEGEISRVLLRYGEERAARRIARAIIDSRKSAPLTSTLQLADLVAAVVPHKPGRKHPATKTFQAIRIFINDELGELEKGLHQALDALAVGGRLCVISFHSLEDRIVKRFLRDNSRVDPALSRLPMVPDSAQPHLRLPSKAIRAGEQEVQQNPRSRSATLRVGECIA
jgi:16S rRNA (cytosine1402-N4)-methyltransferase